MFEQTKIASSINFFLRSVKGTAELTPAPVELMLKPLLPAYAQLMRTKKLTPDQTAVALITETVANLDIGALTLMSLDNPSEFDGLFRLYIGCERLKDGKPEDFAPYFHQADATVSAWFKLKAMSL